LRRDKGVVTVARNDLGVKLEAEVVTKAKHIVIARRGRGEKITIAEYLSVLLKPLVERDYEKEFPPARPKGPKGS
jgi:hypothetical protein